MGEGHENDLKYFNSQYVEYNFEEKESKDINFCFPKKIWEKGKERVKKVKKTIEKRTIKNIKVKKSNNDIFCIKEN